MDIKIELTEQDLENLIANKIAKVLGRGVNIKDVKIYVKSKQNYKSEWEVAAFKAEYHAQDKY